MSSRTCAPFMINLSQETKVLPSRGCRFERRAALQRQAERKRRRGPQRDMNHPRDNEFEQRGGRAAASGNVEAATHAAQARAARQQAEGVREAALKGCRIDRRSRCLYASRPWPPLKVGREDSAPQPVGATDHSTARGVKQNRNFACREAGSFVALQFFVAFGRPTGQLFHIRRKADLHSIANQRAPDRALLRGAFPTFVG